MKLKRFHALKILEWCQEQYGPSKYNKGVLSLEFKKPDYLTEGLLGHYDDIENMIYINSVDHETLEELCKTVIEEYGHYLLSDDEYQKLSRIYKYTDHPHEVFCKNLANRDYKMCLEKLKSEYKQFH